MINLCIDQGNSSVKWGLFKDGILHEQFRTEGLDLEFLNDLLGKYDIQYCILSSVVHIQKDFSDWAKSRFRQFFILDQNTALPIANLYKTPATLGKDRLAAAVGAYSACPHRELLVIDAGTAITLDRVNESGEYLGGNISPGIEMRFKALNVFTGKLPLVDLDQIPDTLFGDDTVSALRLGVLQGIVHEVQGYINELSQGMPSLCVFLTGGSMKILEGKIKSPIFADRNLVLTGLNSILEFNVQKN